MMDLEVAWMENGFDGGIEFGGLRSGYEVSILVCYLLMSVGEPLSAQEISEALLAEGLVNYFELTNSLAELRKLEQVFVGRDRDGLEQYILTPKGKDNAKLLDRELPKSVREKAVQAILRTLARKKRLKENRTEIHQVEDGFQVTLHVLDIGSDLMKLELFVPDLEVAKQVRTNFLNDPGLLYKGVLALLTGDMKTVGELAPSKEPKLFE